MKTRITVIVLVLFLYGIAAAADSVIPPKRIVSLAPSMTEILYALGLGDNIVGVTTFCDYPEEAKKKPKIGGMSNPSLEAVISLKPDIVVLTTDGNPKEFEERLVSLKIKTFVFQARRLSGLPQGIRELGGRWELKKGPTSWHKRSRMVPRKKKNHPSPLVHRPSRGRFFSSSGPSRSSLPGPARSLTTLSRFWATRTLPRRQRPTIRSIPWKR